MKRTLYLGLAMATAALLQSCSTSKSAFRDVKDDVYYVQSDDKYYKAETAPEEVTKPGISSEERSDYGSRQNPNSASEYEKDRKSYSGEGGDTYINNNYYYDNDYNYTSRIRRFYHPSATFGYHNPYYYHGYRYRPGWNLSFSYGYPSYGWYDPWYSSYSCYDPFWGPSWSNYYYDPYFYPYSYNPYYSPYYSYNKGYQDGYYSNWNNWGGNSWGGNNWGGSGSGSGGGGGINTYYGPRNMQGSHNVLNTGMRNAPPRVRKEEEPIKMGDKPQDIQKDQPRIVVDDKPVLQPGKEAGVEPKTTVVPESRETVPVDNNQNPDQEWKTRYNTPINERPKFDQPANTGGSYEAPKEQPKQPSFEQRNEQPKTEPRYQQPRYQEPKEQPAYEQPRYEQPKYEPRHEQPKYEQPREQPRYEQPKYEQPRYEQPRQNSQPKWDNAPRNNGGGTSSPGSNNNNNNSGKPSFQGR